MSILLSDDRISCMLSVLLKGDNASRDIVFGILHSNFFKEVFDKKENINNLAGYTTWRRFISHAYVLKERRLSSQVYMIADFILGRIFCRPDTSSGGEREEKSAEQMLNAFAREFENCENALEINGFLELGNIGCFEFMMMIPGENNAYELTIKQNVRFAGKKYLNLTIEFRDTENEFRGLK